MSIQAIIWDFGGVLVRTEDRQPREQLAARLGLSYDELSALIFDSHTAQLATIGQLSTRDHWEYVRSALGVSPDELPEVPLYFWGGDRLDADLVDYIRALRPRFKTALLSNAWDDLRSIIDDRYQIADAFDEMIISAEVGLAKPDERIFHLALERLGVSPEQAVFIDDFTRNTTAAATVGLHAIHFQGTAQACRALEELIDHA